MASLNFLQTNSCCAVLAGIGLFAANATYGQVNSINSAVIMPRVFNDIPAATGTYLNSYPGSITLGESGVSRTNGFADRDVWYFSNNGSTPYQFHSGDYFNASFNITLTGNNPHNLGLESGFIFSNPSGAFGGDDQMLVTYTGVAVQFGGPSYYPFSPAAGGYPGAGGSVPNYTPGSTYSMNFIYTKDPNTGNDAFEYAMNGQFAASAPGNPYFDLGGPVGNFGDYLGGYFQIQNDPNNPNESGTAVFSNISINAIPEPSSLALLGLGALAVLARKRRSPQQ
ncbi:MAG TPA: PEP-CTERM sorting domain-containing protein [Candidatus Dormibacteraeota bacterium]|nr:PEP-CTERM sorting domain-containing protein [Candidatus Dormibacteraeota bacterium]